MRRGTMTLKLTLIHIQEDKAIVAGDVTKDDGQRRCQMYKSVYILVADV